MRAQASPGLHHEPDEVPPLCLAHLIIFDDFVLLEAAQEGTGFLDKEGVLCQLCWVGDGAVNGAVFATRPMAE